MSAGLLGSAQRLLASLVGLAHTRLELLSTELQETLARLGLAVVGACATLLLAGLGLGFAGIALLLFLAPQYQATAAAALALLFLAAAGLVALAVRARERPRAFDASRAELLRDTEALAP